MEPIEHSVLVYETLPPGTKVIPQPGGGYRYEQPEDYVSPVLVPGSGKTYRIRVQKKPER